MMRRAALRLTVFTHAVLILAAACTLHALAPVNPAPHSNTANSQISFDEAACAASGLTVQDAAKMGKRVDPSATQGYFLAGKGSR
jgi:hypothetical protein